MPALRYILFNKPYAVMTVFTDSEGRPTLADYVPIPDVYPAGRLDFRSEGLLLLTDDGDLAHRMTHPHFEHSKTYLAQVEGIATPEMLLLLREGVTIRVAKKTHQKTLRESETLRVSAVEIIPPPELPPHPVAEIAFRTTSWLKIVLREGKKHQVRHMTAAVGLPTVRLVRVALGPLTVNGLKPGQWRELSPTEVAILKKTVKLYGSP